MKRAALLLLAVSLGSIAAAARPVRVFVLMGQSNMEGHGFVSANPKRNDGKGSLEFLANQGPRFGKFRDASGQWRKRDDVWISYLDRKGPLTAGLGSLTDMIGPELAFGWSMGDAFDEPVLLIKCAWGGKSLAVDFRPPSAGKPAFALGKNEDPANLGKYYRETISQVKAALGRVKELVPGSDGRYVLSGAFWHQGWNDRINTDFTAEYGSNMAHFIRDLRKDLVAPNLPFVIAETGMGGLEEKHPRALALMKAQADVALLPEFRGNVAFVSTRAFWRPVELSPNNQGYHWNCNAETYCLIGESSADAMLGLMKVRRR